MGDRTNQRDADSAGADAINSTGSNAGEVDLGVRHEISRDLGLEGSTDTQDAGQTGAQDDDIADGTGGIGSESGAIGEDITAGQPGVAGARDAAPGSDR